MGYPEPSINDHDAPWNMDEGIDEDGNEIIICGCTSCKAARRKAYDEERRMEGYEYEKI